MNKLLLYTFIFLVSQKLNAQSFLHDTISIENSNFSETFLFGSTSSENVLSLYNNVRTKAKVKKSGKGTATRFHREIKIKMPDESLEFYFKTAPSKDKKLVSHEGKLQYVCLKPDASSAVNGENLLKKMRFELDQMLGEFEITNKKKKIYYYSSAGIEITFYSSSRNSLPKKIIYYESPAIADKNFEIYLKWKSEQNQKE